MNFNNKCVQNMYRPLLIFSVWLFLSCTTYSPEEKTLLKEEYPWLYEAVFERDADEILTYTDSQSEKLAAQAWRAMISTPVDDVESLLEKVVAANTDEAWASLWFQDLKDAHIARLNMLWDEEPELRTGLVTVLGYHGNKETFDRLTGVEVPDLETGLAIGRLTNSLELSIEDQLKVVALAFDADEPPVTQALLYGFYRTRKEIPAEVEAYMLDRWEYFSSPLNVGPIQYLVRILMKNHPEQTLYHFEMSEFEFMEPRLAIEFARSLATAPYTKQTPVVLNALLDNINVNVRIETLLAIKAQQENLDGQMDRIVLNKIGLIRGYNAALRLHAFLASGMTGDYLDDVEELTKDQPYLSGLKYRILSEYLSDSEMLSLLAEDAGSGNRLIRYYALNQLAGWWNGLESKGELTDEVRELVHEQMKTSDRSMTYVMSGLFSDSTLILDSEYDKVAAMLERFSLPEDVEVFQAMAPVLKNRFEDLSGEYIMTLAAEGSAALNSTLKNAGWEIPEIETKPTTFREPDWKRLVRLGPNPILMLETNKGDIKIVMDVLSAPATIAGMDELIRDKAYNGTPFHRVIPNFVAQGGDVESQDGFGGPDFVVPTEATNDQYYRAKVGIASAGRDTEGSQYFIMYDWMPHLNGRYTIVGEVYEGMKVVDRIVNGDYVRKAYWY